MPELPDVEIYKRYLDATSLHQKIRKVEVTNEKILEGVSRERLISELEGHKMMSSLRHGKYLFVRLDSDRWLLFHFGMTGDLSFFAENKDRPEYGRLVLTFTSGYCLACISRRLLGKIALADDPHDYMGEKGLGPDALSLDSKGFEKALGRRGMIKSLLLNQKRIAGIGNVYADEILFQAGLHPQKEVQLLTDDEKKVLYRQLKYILETAIERKADPGKMPETWLLPYRGREVKCPSCKGTLTHLKVGGRTAWYCPLHQKM